jgi:hypothetical protein
MEFYHEQNALQRAEMACTQCYINAYSYENNFDNNDYKCRRCDQEGMCYECWVTCECCDGIETSPGPTTH